MNKNYSKNETVKAGLSDKIGTIIECEGHAVHGWSYNVQFADGSSHWFASTDLTKVIA
jgi:hypothetical protein